MAATKGEYGEGNYKASREYNKATKEFVESGRVEQAARDAAPEDESEAMQMANAEAEGRRRAKEEDPALRAGPENQPAGKPAPERPADATRTPEPGKEGS
jgi:hypothetical protein